jgi:Domain of unknown function (DUF4328)/Protein of unknown function (DUF2510)
MDDQRTSYPGAPPGWYSDPAGGPGQRWWDGYVWSDAVVLPSQPAPPPPGYGYGSSGFGQPNRSTPSGPGDPGVLAESELRLAPVARIAFALPSIYLFINLISIRVNRTQYRALGHQFDLAMKAAQHNRPAPTLVAPDQFNGLIGALMSAVGLASVVAVIVACIWQFRAATSARALGYPAHRSPGWGVACWFVPIVNFWMPYEAILDCLAPGDPGRQLIGRWWLSVSAMWTMFWLAAITACFSDSVALVFVLCGGLACLATAAMSPRVVETVASAHRSAVGQSEAATRVGGR